MGLFCVNFHVRTADDQAVAAALKKRKVTRHRLLPAKGGWVTFFEEQASQQDDERIRDLGSKLSKDLDAPIIAFLVHDSDIACYWLYDKGRLVDEYNSCPDYFDEDADGEGKPSGGQLDVLLRYCRSGVTENQLSEILHSEQLFAESMLEKLAHALGIAPERALGDYRHDDDDDSDDEAGDDDGDSPSGGVMSRMRSAIAGRFGQLLGFGAAEPADPVAQKLVDAASRGDVAEIDRLVGEGATVDASATMELPIRQLPGGQAPAFSGVAPKLAATPLLAAIAHKQHAAAERLLVHGANPNQQHPLYGTAIHAAAGAGEVELVKLLIEHGSDVSARNAHGQTPLQVIAGGRAAHERFTQSQAAMKAMGVQFPALTQQWAKVTLPVEGWIECERLLKEHGAE